MLGRSLGPRERKHQIIDKRVPKDPPSTTGTPSPHDVAQRLRDNGRISPVEAGARYGWSQGRE